MARSLLQDPVGAVPVILAHTLVVEAVFIAVLASTVALVPYSALSVPLDLTPPDLVPLSALHVMQASFRDLPVKHRAPPVRLVNSVQPVLTHARLV
jgi:hypothetical protein